MCEFLCKGKPSFVSGKYLGVQWLGWMVVACLIFKDVISSLPKQLNHTTFSAAVSESSTFSASVPAVGAVTVPSAVLMGI